MGAEVHKLTVPAVMAVPVVMAAVTALSVVAVENVSVGVAAGQTNVFASASTWQKPLEMQRASERLCNWRRKRNQMRSENHEGYHLRVQVRMLRRLNGRPH